MKKLKKLKRFQELVEKVPAEVEFKTLLISHMDKNRELTELCSELAEENGSLKKKNSELQVSSFEF